MGTGPGWPPRSPSARRVLLHLCDRVRLPLRGQPGGDASPPLQLLLLRGRESPAVTSASEASPSISSDPSPRLGKMAPNVRSDAIITRPQSSSSASASASSPADLRVDPAHRVRVEAGGELQLDRVHRGVEPSIGASRRTAMMSSYRTAAAAAPGSSAAARTERRPRIVAETSSLLLPSRRRRERRGGRRSSRARTRGSTRP